MQHINITIQRIGSRLQLIRGQPEQIGLQTVKAHMLFDHGDIELEVWIVCSLSILERQQITQSGLTYLDSLTSLESASSGSPERHLAGQKQETPLTKRVLIVDDEEFTLEVFQTFLELSGYQVITTINSEQAVHLVEQEHPDCVLLDVMMPGMDGFSLCKLIRSTPSIGKIPIIFCTAYPALDVEDRRKAAGGDLVIMKPFEMNALVGAIESMLPHQDQQAEAPAEATLGQHPALRPKVKQTTPLGTASVFLDPNATTNAYMAAFQHLITGQ